MRAGSLKHKIIIQTYTETQNGFGEVIKGWVNFKTAYASITPISAKEFYKSGTKAEATHKIGIRYVVGVKSKMRILYGIRVFDIQSALNPREANKSLVLICTEVL
ncbi:MAG: phage head closure protein [Epsilonproteobacteria bacterium]|nr:phage head closure protein [Campylobacterota bacterium]